MKRNGRLFVVFIHELFCVVVIIDERRSQTLVSDEYETLGNNNKREFSNGGW